MPWAAMASRLGVSLEGWPNTPKSPQPIWRAKGQRGSLLATSAYSTKLQTNAPLKDTSQSPLRENKQRERNSNCNLRHPWARWLCLEMKHFLASLPRSSIASGWRKPKFQDASLAALWSCPASSEHLLQGSVYFTFTRDFSATFAHAQ